MEHQRQCRARGKPGRRLGRRLIIQVISCKSRKSYCLYFHELNKTDHFFLGSNPNAVILTTTKTLHYLVQNLYNLKMEVIIK